MRSGKPEPCGLLIIFAVCSLQKWVPTHPTPNLLDYVAEQDWGFLLLTEKVIKNVTPVYYRIVSNSPLRGVTKSIRQLRMENILWRLLDRGSHSAGEDLDSARLPGNSRAEKKLPQTHTRPTLLTRRKGYSLTTVWKNKTRIRKCRLTVLPTRRPYLRVALEPSLSLPHLWAYSHCAIHSPRASCSPITSDEAPGLLGSLPSLSKLSLLPGSFSEPSDPLGPLILTLLGSPSFPKSTRIRPVKQTHYENTL